MLHSQIANVLAEERGFFDGIYSAEALVRAAAASSSLTATDVPTAVGSEAQQTTRSICADILHKFGKEVLLRSNQFKDELLVACYLFVLSLPTAIIARDPAAFFPAVRGALRIGTRCVHHKAPLKGMMQIGT